MRLKESGKSQLTPDSQVKFKINAGGVKLRKYGIFIFACHKLTTVMHLSHFLCLICFFQRKACGRIFQESNWPYGIYKGKIEIGDFLSFTRGLHTANLIQIPLRRPCLWTTATTKHTHAQGGKQF